ncbi:hypothetical protein CP982_22825 [Streptomyces spectabilis]|uniref:Uncharacterized protein n=1 Tax=Streptomyces spectabilis TaxID=68270 RepID=A0A5P2X9S9_STRST|nr:hypothetical protein CP982_22825 [Streptomyces spectabilis]
MVLLRVLPEIHTLTPTQLSGAACVWCRHALRPGEGIDLGSPGPARPHGCLSCCESKTRSLRTYLDWYDHGITCLRCPTGPCDRGEALGAAHLAVREEAGQPPMRCCACETDIAPGELVRPYLWERPDGPVLGYLHARDCPLPRPPS